LNAFLNRFRTAIGEEEDVDIARRELCQLRAKPCTRLGRHAAWRHVTELRGLLLNGFDHAWIAVADVHRHQLTVEVDVSLSFGRVEVNAFRTLDRNRIDGALRRPF
jgi:hypothetical protein